MRRRRRRWPFVVLGFAALLLGATIAMAVSDVRPSADLLAWLGGQAAGTPSPAASVGGPAGVVATAHAPAEATASAEPAASRAGPGQSAAPISSSAGASAGASAAPSATGGGAPGAAPAGGGPSPSSSAPSASALPTSTGNQARPVYNGSRDRKVVALTFDDGYSPVALRQILAVLEREHATATFFPYGWAVHQDPQGWHMVAAAGFPIGNHTLRHTILTTISEDGVYEEMTRGRRTIDLYSGAKSVNLMRPPGGAYNAPVARAIKKAGYDLIVLWDVDTFDWQGPSPETIYQRAIRGTNGSIVLMHAGPPNTPKALPRIIANYRARGFQFVTVPQLLGTG